jgi:hypothetical protein
VVLEAGRDDLAHPARFPVNKADQGKVQVAAGRFAVVSVFCRAPADGEEPSFVDEQVR